MRTQSVSLKGLTYARIHFTDNREPDLLILLGTAPDQHDVALLVEAKLYAAQHQIEYHGSMLSQLGYYMLRHLRGDYVSPIRPAELPPVRPLLFITLGRTPPKQDLERARSEVMAANPEPSTSDFGIFWCSWGMAGRKARLLWTEHRGDVGEKPWLRLLLDLWRDLEYRDLMREPFQRIPQPIGRLPSWNCFSQVGIVSPPSELPPGIYQERRLIPKPLIGRLPEVVYARCKVGIPLLPPTKRLGPLPYILEEST